MSASINVVYYADTSPAVEAVVAAAMPPEWTFSVVRDAEAPGAREALGAADAVILANLPLEREHVDLLDSAKVVVHQGVGVDHYDVDAIRARRIPLLVTHVGTTGPVAEHTILLMLAACRRLRETTEAVTSRGLWPSWAFRDISTGIAGRTVGLVGLGLIGRAVASRLQGLEARVIAYPGPRGAPDAPQGVELTDSVDELCRRSDVISLHVPLRLETRHLIGAGQLALLPRGAVVVNTARGALIDETALVAALREGRVAAAGLDVLEHEPPAPDNPLLAMPNVVITPHLASGTSESLRAKAAHMATAIAGALAGTALIDRVA